MTRKRAVPAPVPDTVVEALDPVVDAGRFPAKATLGRPLTISADVFTHGHDLVRAVLRARRPGGRRWTELPMTPVGNDRFRGVFLPQALGPHELEVAGCVDELATWARDARRRLEANRSDPFDPETGAGLLEAAASALAGTGATAGAGTATAGAGAAKAGAGTATVGAGAATVGAGAAKTDAEDGAAAVRALAARCREKVDLDLLDDLAGLADVLSRRPAPVDAVTERLRLIVARQKAEFSSWYELFPRSASPEPSRPGTLADVADRLEYVASMGFDVLYLPPIHPIGVTARKGKGNTTTPVAGDVGSPWAIGSAAGGHSAVAPELGTLEDFDQLVAAAAARGIEIALDLAFQMSPDHPWVGEHPDWFRHRPDGSIACAENPPKRYDDIFPIDFHTVDRVELWEALLGVVRFWADRGVRIFRVDNPHTKPFAFWEWMIAEVKRDDPDVIFLSEAFTRPRVMHRLAKVGFDQSYTYFTWRYEKWDIAQYFEELAHGPGRSYFRPNVWPNTPDILAGFLQRAPRASFVARLVLAAGLSSNYGIYGPVFELQWNTPERPGSEEYMASEKYQVHHHDLDEPGSLRPIIARVNAARHDRPALQHNDGLVFLPVDNDQLIAWAKHDAPSGDAVIAVVSLDPSWPQSGFVDVSPLAARAGWASACELGLQDVLSGERYTWSQGRNFVKLDPAGMAAHLCAVEPQP